MPTLDDLLATGWALANRGDFLHAEQIARQTVALSPTSAAAWACLGLALYNQRQWEAAIDAYTRAIESDPQLLVAWSNLGMIYTDLARVDRAVECFDRAIAIDSACLPAHKNKAVALLVAGRVNDALAAYEGALNNWPADADLHMQLGMLLLLSGDFARGWPEYEWRLQIEPKLPAFEGPVWDGSPPIGKRILLRPEQGIGDTVQFLRYASVVKRLGATVFVECPSDFLPLFRTCPGIDRLVGFDDEHPAFDFQVPLLSLPRLMHTTLENIPNQVPYLFADNELVDLWRCQLNETRAFRIGINWQGRVGPVESHQRDIPLACFASLAQVPGVCLISLHKGAGREELTAFGRTVQTVDLGGDVDTAHGAFMDTAAIMMNLDLVITSDTAVAHVAGALGVPVWVVLPFAADWRWLQCRTDSPWYPSMRLFRQKSRGDWTGVFEEIKFALQQQLSS